MNVLSTVYNSSTFTNKIRSRFADNHYKEIEKPRAIALYSKYMSGVDLTDQQVSYTALTNRMLKWWKKVVLCNLLEITVANTKVIHKQARDDDGRYNNDNFRPSIIEGSYMATIDPKKHSAELLGSMSLPLENQFTPIVKYVATGK